MQLECLHTDWSEIYRGGLSAQPPRARESYKGITVFCGPIRPAPFSATPTVNFFPLLIKLSFFLPGLQRSPISGPFYFIFYKSGFKTLYGFEIQIISQNETLNHDFKKAL